MKFSLNGLIIVVGLLFIISTSRAQGGKYNNTAESVINKVIKSLNKLPAFSYKFTRETKYHSDNYFNNFTASIYVETYMPSVIGIRYQTTGAEMNTIFNGQQIFKLDTKSLTIDSSSVSLAQMKSNSFLYHSYAMLKQCLPLVLIDSSFNKSLSDTIINGNPYWAVFFEKANSYFGLYSGLETFDKKLQLKRPYILIVDKANFLPKLFISRYIRGNDDRDYVAITYDEVNIHPKLPAKTSWNYASYSKKYKPFIPEKKQSVVKLGTPFSGFLLNEYQPKGDLLVPFSKYKGKVVLLEFWFKSCGPCIEAMPQYNSLQNSFPNDSFQLITINIEDTRADMAFFYKKFPPNFPMLYNGAALFKSLGFTGCPTALLINENGIIVKIYNGFNAEKVKSDISELLKQ